MRRNRKLLPSVSNQPTTATSQETQCEQAADFYQEGLAQEEKRAKENEEEDENNEKRPSKHRTLPMRTSTEGKKSQKPRNPSAETRCQYLKLR